MAPVPSGRQAGSPPIAPYPVPALDAVAPWLRCPSCSRGPLHRDRRRLLCPAGHAFDIARQGFVTLVAGHRRRHPGDDARMVAARERFLAGGHYRPLSSTLAALTAEHQPPAGELVVDLAGGTGHHLAAVLDACPQRYGLCVDASAPALRRAARAHPRAAAVGADVWDALPVRTGVAGAVLSVFGPRNAEEVERVLAPGGIAVVASPRPAHLEELTRLTGVVGVDPRKPERLAAAFRRFEPVALHPVTWRLALRPDEVRTLVAMTPSAHHVCPDRLDGVVARLPAVVGVTVAVDVAVHRRPATR